jgi:MerR family transcriptional regulator, redox-sensitive transcriptional activator SoxR
MALRDNLDSCIGCGCLSLKRCAIANPADSAAVAGPGAVYLPKSLR